MIINRVFCYSKVVALKNGNELPILQLVLTIIFEMLSLCLLGIMIQNASLSLIIIFILTGILTYYIIILRIRLKTKMTGYATDTKGRVFKVMTVNNGQGLYFGGVAAGGLIDQLAGNDSSIGKNLGGAVGAAAQFYAINRSANYMSQPEIVAKMVELAPNITGAEVFEILKVYSITDKGKSVKVNCDYKILRTNKIKYSKNLTIEKSFNMFEDLISALNKHR